MFSLRSSKQYIFNKHIFLSLGGICHCVKVLNSFAVSTSSGWFSFAFIYTSFIWSEALLSDCFIVLSHNSQSFSVRLAAAYINYITLQLKSMAMRQSWFRGLPLAFENTVNTGSRSEDSRRWGARKLKIYKKYDTKSQKCENIIPGVPGDRYDGS